MGHFRGSWVDWASHSHGPFFHGVSDERDSCKGDWFREKRSMVLTPGEEIAERRVIDPSEIRRVIKG